MIPEGTTWWGVALKQALVGASAFSCGVLVYRALVVEWKRRRPFLVTGLLGVVGALLLIGEVVVRAPIIRAEWRTYAYLVFLLMIFVGFLGDAIRQKHRYEVEEKVLDELEEQDDA